MANTHKSIKNDILYFLVIFLCDQSLEAASLTVVKVEPQRGDVYHPHSSRSKMWDLKF